MPALPANIRLVWEAKDVAYLDSSSVTKKITVFIKGSLCVNVIKLFSFVTVDEAK